MPPACTASSVPMQVCLFIRPEQQFAMRKDWIPIIFVRPATKQSDAIHIAIDVWPAGHFESEKNGLFW